MDENLELIERQMRETRSNLSERVETLEREVFGMVHETTAAITGSMDNAKAAVHETVSDVKDSLHEVIETLRDTVDIRLQVERHPYAMLCGAVILGYLTPRLIDRLTAQRIRQNGQSFSQAHALAVGRAEGTRQLGHEQEALVPQGQLANELSTFTDGKFASEISRLKAIVIGAALGALRDYVVESAPGQIAPELGEIIDSFTLKVGGRPVPGPVLHRHHT